MALVTQVRILAGLIIFLILRKGEKIAESKRLENEVMKDSDIEDIGKTIETKDADFYIGLYKGIKYKDYFFVFDKCALNLEKCAIISVPCINKDFLKSTIEHYFSELNREVEKRKYLLMMHKNLVKVWLDSCEDGLKLKCPACGKTYIVTQDDFAFASEC